MSALRRSLRLAAHGALALLPGAVKVPIYRRVFGFEIAPDARIGFSILDVDHLKVESGARIGHGNLLTRTRSVTLGHAAEIGFCNVVRGGDDVRLDDFSTVMRFNVLNSIPDNDAAGPTDARLTLGKGAYVVSGHRIDFTDRISIGKNVIIAGRNSSLWTHNRQATGPIEIGDWCYVGSEVRIAPGATLGAESILGMGAVLTGRAEAGKMHGGVPAKPIRELSDEERKKLHDRSRNDIPDGEL
jgi:acetyltransferase-like isoleucine patch superfamily enzyme